MKIVVHIDAGDSWPRRADAAARLLAARGGGRVLGVFGQMATALASYAYHGDKAAIDREAAPQRDRFFEIMAPFGSVAAEWHTIHSVNPDFIAAEITANAQYADLTVLGQIDPRATADRVPADLAEQVVLNCGRPVLMIPYTGTYTFAFSRVLVAYNDSRESSRALGDALPFIHGAQAWVMVVRHAPELIDPSDWRWVELKRRLEDHGVQATVETPAIANISVADFLLSQAADLSADLLVMGAYGKLGLPRMLRGSVTRDILRQMTLPVLLGH
ncbi:universal stress protein [Pararhodospirillum oryzae]|uniref:Universal stress protein UspA n=1 Tax=Pararhodospirillum oryzae TaxID=478448 RepID=A0A512H6L8_9PROT|nr:universal stress protein [Pararhodospirillum oryzae]GEO81082.1 universal stress protein UspA [Pararhodospirillum oryzae]